MCFEAQLIKLEGDLVVIDGWERRQPKPRQSDAARSRKYREKKKNEKSNDVLFQSIDAVTNRHDASRDASRAVTSRVEENREEKNRKEDHAVASQISPLFEETVDLAKAWNEKANGVLSRVSRVTDKRKAAQKRFLRALTEKDFYQAIAEIHASDFLSGRGGSTWKATFDWAINPNNATKVLEGNYRNPTTQQPSQSFKRFDKPLTAKEKFERLVSAENKGKHENV